MRRYHIHAKEFCTLGNITFVLSRTVRTEGHFHSVQHHGYPTSKGTFTVCSPLLPRALPQCAVPGTVHYGGVLLYEWFLLQPRVLYGNNFLRACTNNTLVLMLMNSVIWEFGTATRGGRKEKNRSTLAPFEGYNSSSVILRT